MVIIFSGICVYLWGYNDIIVDNGDYRSMVIDGFI